MSRAETLVKKLEFYITQVENILMDSSPESSLESKHFPENFEQLLSYNKMEVENMKKFTSHLVQLPPTSLVSCIDIVEGLNLRPHEEGGFYRKFLTTADISFIFYLLPEGAVSAWHRLDGVQETFRWVAGDSLYIPRVSRQGLWLGVKELTQFGPDVVITAGQIDEKDGSKFGDWFGAYHCGNYSLITCECRPSFRYEKWQLASPEHVQNFFGVEPKCFDIVEKLEPKTIKDVESNIV